MSDAVRRRPLAADAADREIIDRARADPQAFGAIYDKYAPAIYNYILFRNGHDAAEAEDLTQEVFVRAYRHLSRFRWTGSPYAAYLYRIAHNLLVSSYRARAARQASLDDVEVPYEIAETLEKRLELRGLWRALQTLPEDQRSALLMFYQRDWPIGQIARVMGRTPNAAKLLLARGRKALKQMHDVNEMKQWGKADKPDTAPRFLNPLASSPVRRRHRRGRTP